VTHQVLTRSARRTLTESLPEPVASAVFGFLAGDLFKNPRRVGKPLGGPYQGYHGARRGEYRIIYRIDDVQMLVDVIEINHRRDVCRT
jgi:mRNA interferase RelE/StbE